MLGPPHRLDSRRLNRPPGLRKYRLVVTALLLLTMAACDSNNRAPAIGDRLPQSLPLDGGTDGGITSDDNRIEDGSSGIGPDSCHCSCTSGVDFDFGWIVGPGLTPDDDPPSCWVFDSSSSREYDVFVNGEPFLITDPDGAAAEALREGRFFVGFRVTSDGPNDECMIRDQVSYDDSTTQGGASEWERHLWLRGPTNPSRPATYSFELSCRNSGSLSDPGVREAALYVDVYERDLRDEPDAGTGIVRHQRQSASWSQGGGHER